MIIFWRYKPWESVVRITSFKTAYQTQLRLVEHSLIYFTPMFPFSFPLARSENQKFSNVFDGRRDKKGT